MYIVPACNIMYLSLYFRYFTKLFYLIVEFQISCRTVAPPEIRVDGRRMLILVFGYKSNEKSRGFRRGGL